MNRELRIADCGLRIADCGLQIGIPQLNPLNPLNPQSAIRNPQCEGPC